MANEIAVSKEGLVSLVQNQQLGDIIKPLVKEIHLFDSYVAGTTRLKDASVLGRVSTEDELTLRREENKFDDDAIVILTKEQEKLGYVPEKDETVFARLMDAGKLLKAKVTKIERKESFTQISIGIYLADF